MFRFKHTHKFYLGMVLIIGSFIVGKISTATFLLYLGDPSIRWLSIIAYVLSWIILVIGGWWVGKEYVEEIKKYISYKYYHESIKEGTKQIKEGTKQVVGKTKQVVGKTKQVMGKTKAKTKELHASFRRKLEKKSREG
ncbi:MAG: hypothetical protein AB1668_02785 [Nanoarchaeota archaeon]